MKRMQRAAAIILFLLLLLPFGRTLAETEPQNAPSAGEMDKGSTIVDQGAEEAVAAPKGAYDETLYKQIQETYKAAKKRAHRRSFKGYCGAYVANQLVVLGINTSYLSANGKNTYDIYRKLDCTTGGYQITAYGAKQYSLREALTAILKRDTAATNILVGFQKGVSSAGKKYGHVLFIHGVRNGMIYYSDSCARTVDEIRYKEGEPIVCSISSFVDLYAKYKLDGVVHFQKDKLKQSAAIQSDSIAVTDDTSAQKQSAED